MAAIMPATSGGNQTANPYQRYDEPVVDDDLIDPDDGMSPTPQHIRIDLTTQLSYTR